MARDRVLQIRCSAAEIESLENQARGWGGPVSAYVRMVLFGPVAKSPAVKPTEAASPKEENYLAKVQKQLAESLKRDNKEYVRMLLSAPPADAPIAGLKFEVKPRAVCDHKPFKRKDGLTVCEKCGVRL